MGSEKGGVPVWLWVLAVGFFVGSLGVVTVAAGAMYVLSKPRPTPTYAQQQVATKREYKRDEFRKLVSGMTQDELVSTVGRPDTSTEISSGAGAWHYRGITRDTATGKLDTVALVSIRDGKVVEVSFW